MLTPAPSLAQMDIGWLGFIASLGSLVCGPIYGWLLDQYGSLTAVSLAAAACSIGCLVRGMAIDVNGLCVVLLGLRIRALSNEFITLSGMSDTLCWVLERKICGRQSYRMLYGTQSLRDESVSFQDTSFRCVLDTTQSPCSADFQSTWLLQVTALRIVGRALYPPFNFLLEDGFQMTQTLPRMRIHMGMCTAFCFFGTARLLGNWGVIQASTTGAESFEDSKVGSVTGGLSAAVTPFGIKTTEPQPTKFALFAVCNY